MRNLINSLIAWVKAKIKEQLRIFRAWLNRSKIVLAITMLIIGISWTYVYDHRADIETVRKIRIEVNIAEASGMPVKAGVHQAIEHTEPQNSSSGETGQTESNPNIALVKQYFGSQWKTAYAVMLAESGGNPKAPSITDKLSDGRAYSIGLFQINLTVSKIAGVDCSKAFVGKNNDARLIDEELFQQCVRLAENPKNNLQVAKEKYESRGNFTAWGAYNNGAYQKYLD